MDVLTPREANVLRLILKGLDNATMSERLGKSIRTIEGVRRELSKRFNAHTTLGLIMESMQYGFLTESIDEYFASGKHLESSEYLTVHEHAVLQEMLAGKTTPEIAKNLKMTRRSVDYYRANINRKWAVDSPVDLVLKAIQKSYVKVFAITTELEIGDTQKVWDAFQTSMKIDHLKNIEIIYCFAFSYPHYFEKQLTRAQREVVYLRLHGKSNAHIAAMMKISEKSVIRHFSHARTRLNAITPGELVKKASGAGAITIIPALYTNKILNEIEVSTMILLSDGMEIKHIANAMQTTQDHIKETILDLKTRYNVETIEGVLVSALRKGHIRNLL